MDDVTVDSLPDTQIILLAYGGMFVALLVLSIHTLSHLQDMRNKIKRRTTDLSSSAYHTDEFEQLAKDTVAFHTQ